MLTSQKSKTWVLLFAAYAVLQVLWVGWISYQHLTYPLNLEAMETTVVEHVERVLKSEPLFATPNGDHVALAYNPLFYYLCALFALVLGPSLLTIRLVALVGTLGAAWMIYRIVKTETQSRWWGLIGVGMFAASYRAMDSYFDVGHRDTWTLFLVLAGCSVLNYNRNGFGRAAGMLLLVTAFWFKQQAAVFAIGGFLFLLFHATAAQCLFPGLLALVFGPTLYVLAPESLLGSSFHYFTWDVPRQWTALSREDTRNFAELVARRWLMPTVLTGAGLMSALRTGAFRSIWVFMVPVAFVTALLGMVVSGSNNNVFIPFETWLILISVIAVERLTRSLPEHTLWPQIALAISFLALLYNPRSVVTSPDAQSAYRDLLQFGEQLDGPVYAPWLGHVPGSQKFQPAAHWVPLEDTVRGAEDSLGSRARIAEILDSTAHPKTVHSYILTNSPLETDGVLSFLQESYVLQSDLGERFRGLQGLPRRYTPSWPHLLYRYDPAVAEQQRKLARR